MRLRCVITFSTHNNVGNGITIDRLSLITAKKAGVTIKNRRSTYSNKRSSVKESSVGCGVSGTKQTQLCQREFSGVWDFRNSA